MNHPSIVAFLLALLLLLSGCASSTDDASDTSSEKNSSAVTTESSSILSQLSLEEIANTLYDQVNFEFPTLVGRACDLSDSTAFAYDFGIEPSGEIQEAYISEPMIGSMAYTLGLIRLSDTADAAQIASSVQKNVDPAKWVCVTASTVETAVNGRVILLILDTDADRAAAVLKAFSSL